MERVKRKRVRIGRVMMLVVGCVLAVALLVGGTKVILNLFDSQIIADEYAIANTTNKNEDDKIKDEVYSEKDEETDEEFIYAIHTPELDDGSNEKINEFLKTVKAEKAKVTHVDFESNQAFGQYKSYVITAVTYSEMEELNPVNEVGRYSLYLNFDGETFIELDDCLRGKAIDILANQNNVDKEEVSLVKITEKGVIINANGKDIEFTYQDNKSSFVMNNSNIPTILKYPKIEVEEREIDPNRPMVAFTFDDGPAPGNTERILEALKKVNGRATFFELGSLMEVYPDTVRAICESGSEVANHSYDHPWLTHLPIEEAIDQVQKTNDIYFSLTGHEINLLRPPFGDMNSEVAKSFSEKMVYWDVDTRDWESRNTEKIIEVAKQYIYDGSIVLFHDIHATTIPAVEQLIAYYDSLGYQFVTVSELYQAEQ